MDNDMTKNNKQDIRTRFIFEEYPIRGLHVSLEEVWQNIIAKKQYPAPILQALGELLAATVLLASNLKFDGTLIAQVQGKGAVQVLVAEATSIDTCRATARWHQDVELSANMSLKDLMGENGIFVLSIQPNNGEMWQGIVPLEGDNLAEMLMQYMYQSEQLDTFIRLNCSDNKIVGFLLQKMPSEVIAEDGRFTGKESIAADGWQTMMALSQTINSDELTQLDAETLLYRLFHEQQVRVFNPDSVVFSCSCSSKKVADMLLLLGGEEVANIVHEQGTVDIACDFCGNHYVFDEEEVNELFGMDIMSAVQKQ